MNASLWSLLLLGACAEAPDPITNPTARGVLLLGGGALDTSAVLDDLPIGALPVAVEAGTHTLRIAGAPVPIEPDASLLLYARAGGETPDTLVLGGDVHADRLGIDAPEAVVRELAARLDASVEPDGERWQLATHDIWTRAAALDADPRVREVFPIEIADEPGGGDTMMSVGAPRRAPTPPAPTPQIGAPSTTTTTCGDALAGIWVGRTFRTDAGDWHEFTLDLHRAENGHVAGSIAVRFWVADDRDSMVPTCANGSPAIGRAAMAATGKWDGKQLDLTAQRLTAGPELCGVETEYNLDHFVGRLRSDGRIAATNNDGKQAVNRPYVFERVSCR